MKDTEEVFSICKIVAAILSRIWLYQREMDADYILERTLVVLCFIALDYLLNMRLPENDQKQNAVIFLTRIISIGIIFGIGSGDYSLVCVIIGTQLTDSVMKTQGAMQWVFVSCAVIAELLLAMIGSRQVLEVGIECCTLLTLGYTVMLKKHLNTYQEERFSQRKEINELCEKLQHNRQITRNIRYAAGLEERNRLAVRLHDKIGHNISGSIMILEAAMLQHEKNPEKAMKSVKMATDNLKEGVNEIRAALREERPVLREMGYNDLLLLLGELETKHNFHTFFRTEGPLEELTAEQWKCIYDNARELITNTVKHSKGTMFTIEIHVMNRIVKVLYYDNGACGSFIKGMGLQAIEERSIKCGGKCFFESSQDGFKSTLIFTNYQYRGEKHGADTDFAGRR